MSVRAPSSQQIASQIDAVLQRMPEARLIGIRSPTRRSWPETIERAGQHFRLLWSESGLELRERVAAAEAGEERLVVLTALPDEALGTDLLARFAKARLLQPNIWEMLRSAFQARDVDPRLAGEEWLAELLLEHAPPAGYPPTAGGVLDADKAWRHGLASAIGLDATRPDVETLLQWTLDDVGLEQFLALPEEVRQRIAKRLEDVGGGPAGLVMGAVVAGHGPSALALGLVLGVIFGDGEERELRDAAVRLEPVFGRRIERAPAERLAFAAGRLMGRLDRAIAEACQSRAAEWLERLHIDPFARLSDHVALGFDQRLQDAAARLRTAVDDSTRLARAEEAIERLFAHDRARIEATRAERLRMALRLARWLMTPEAGPARVDALAARYAREGGFVDLARATLFGGEPLADVSATYGAIVGQATTRRERENEAFARALEQWNRESGATGDLVPVEAFLDRVLAPLATDVTLLLIVLDGLSYAVHRDLLRDMVRQGWVELVPAGRTEAPPLVAALPSLTEISRTSLLSGRLARGKAADERNAFSRHPALVAASRSHRPPVLFHKAALGLANGLADEVRSAIADPQQRVVGVVHNVVDAQLDGSDQLDVHWALNDLRLVRALLREARDAGRIVVVAGDHGHVLDHETVQHTARGGARWRPADTPPEPFEMLFEGGRVLTPDGTRRAVLAWSETVRYGAKSRGYHGGAAPQEVLTPVAVLTATAGPVLGGWSEAPPVEPEWWEQTVAALPPLLATVAEPKRRPARRTEAQPQLFDEPAPATRRGWIDALLASPTYTAQRQLAGRTAPRDDDIASLLRALDERGGRLSQTALAQALRQPVVRMGGLVSATARVLNVDQARVLQFDRASQSVTLDRALLERQFEIRTR